MADPQQTTVTVTPTTVDISDQSDRSMFFGMSVRAFLALLIVTTFCASAITRTIVPLIQLFRGEPTAVDIPQELNNLTIAVVGFYLGQKYK